VVVVNDTANDTTFMPWREPALRRGYCGCTAFPLRRDGVVIGALAIYAAERNRFDADQIELLSGLADDIGFKLDALEADARRRAAEQAMRRSEERYRALVEQAADAILLADAGGRLIEVNAAACAMTGRAREELVGQQVDALFEPVELRDSRGTQSTSSGERRLRKPDQTIVDAEVTSIVLADGRVQIYARDVTQRNIAQQQLILADRLASLGRLAAGVAHEINNPLTYVALNLERIERESHGDPSAGALARIRNGARDARDGAERVRDIVRALGAFSREDEGAVVAIDLHRVIDGALRLAENSVRQRARVVKEYGAVRGVRGNELRLGQVFVNLLVNAADAFGERAAEENEIHVRTVDQGERVVVDVRDNGAGIAPEIIDRIFDPFFTTKPVGEGTGLGLSISHGIVAAFGGRIDVESRPGRGTTFRVSLLADATLAGPSAEARSAAVARTPSPAPKPRVLIVDDEERLARSLALSLEGHEVAIATSGREALAAMQARVFDCIVCDLMMPDLSGMDLHAELTRAGRGEERRMVFMTGGAFTPRSREFVGEVPNEVIEKPFSTGRLETAIAVVVTREGRR
jgi:PAS domain S-box-containing protein